LKRFQRFSVVGSVPLEKKTLVGHVLIFRVIFQAIRDFSCDHVLIQSDIPGHSKQSSMFRNKQKLRSGNIGTRSKSAEFVGRSFSIVTLTHSFTQQDSIVASPP